MGHLIPENWSYLKKKKKKKEEKNAVFAVLADHWVKTMESEKLEKYLDLNRELKMLWNMKVVEIATIIGKS